MICLRHVFTRRLTATFKGICPGHATKCRAIFYGLKHLALHSKEKVTVAIYDHAVWKAWQTTRAYECFPDLFEGLEPEDFTQVRKELDTNAASFSKKLTKKPRSLPRLPGMKKSWICKRASMKTHETFCVSRQPG